MRKRQWSADGQAPDTRGPFSLEDVEGVPAWLAPNALVVLGLVGGAAFAALLSGQFTPRRPRRREALRGLAGGALLGWGAMTALGCTIGTVLSGVMAGALAGWVFAAAVFAGVWLGLRAGLAAPRPSS